MWQRSLLASFLVMLATTPAPALDYTWTGLGADDLWTTDGNWDQLSPPYMDGDDNAIIPSGTAIYDRSVWELDFTTMPGSDLTIQTGGTWLQTTSNWSRINGGLNLDGGAFTRTGGGNHAFGSFLESVGASTSPGLAAWPLCSNSPTDRRIHLSLRWDSGPK